MAIAAEAVFGRVEPPAETGVSLRLEGNAAKVGRPGLSRPLLGPAPSVGCYGDTIRTIHTDSAAGRGTCKPPSLT